MTTVNVIYSAGQKWSLIPGENQGAINQYVKNYYHKIGIKSYVVDMT